jgi:hypothetical protein
VFIFLEGTYDSLGVVAARIRCTVLLDVAPCWGFDETFGCMIYGEKRGAASQLYLVIFLPINEVPFMSDTSLRS